MKVQNFAAQHVRQPSVLQHQAGLHYKTIQEIEVGKHFFLNGRKKLGEGRKKLLQCQDLSFSYNSLQNWGYQSPQYPTLKF
jgi:hypothetical protein